METKKRKKDKKEWTIRLTIKSIIYYEKITLSPFSKFEGNEEQVLPLIYSMLIANNPSFRETYETCIQYLFTDASFMEEIKKDLEKEILFIQQFNNKEKEKEKGEREEKTEEKEKENASVFITDTIPILTKDCGLDINYVLNEMSYLDVDLFFKYKDESMKNKMEEKRLFTYLSVAPHINTKKCPLTKFLPFSWEKEEKKKEGEKMIRENSDKLKEFMESGIITKEKIINNNG